jgi:hypothetical protein
MARLISFIGFVLGFATIALGALAHWQWRDKALRRTSILAGHPRRGTAGRP